MVKFQKKSGGTIESGSKVIITTGDISDVDGWYALAEYAKTDADVIFIMNYPAYLSNTPPIFDNCISNLSQELKEKAELGLGFNYTQEEYLKFYNEKILIDGKVTIDTKPNPCIVPENQYNTYKQIVSQFDNNLFKAFTYIGAYMSAKVFKEAKSKSNLNSNKGNLYFAIGGINLINPFSKNSLKNEVLVYADLLKDLIPQQFKNAIGKSVLKNYNIFTELNSILNSVNNTTINLFRFNYDNTYVNYTKVINLNEILNTKEIFVDMNGSAAFWNNSWETILRAQNIKGFHIMGGVLGDLEPWTVGPFKDTIRRLPSATMNQLYHPQKTVEMIKFMLEKKVPIFTIPNNSILTDNQVLDHFKKLFKSEDKDYLFQLANAYYGSSYGPPKKPFDYIVAKSLVKQMTDTTIINNDTKQFTMFVDGCFGMSIITNEDSFKDALPKLEIDKNNKTGEKELLSQSLNNVEFKCYVVQVEKADYKSGRIAQHDYFKNSNPIVIDDLLSNYSKPVEPTVSKGGSKHDKKITRSANKFMIGNKQYSIYLGVRGGKYIKYKGQLVPLHRFKK